MTRSPPQAMTGLSGVPVDRHKREHHASTPPSLQNGNTHFDDGRASKRRRTSLPTPSLPNYIIAGSRGRQSRWSQPFQVTSTYGHQEIHDINRDGSDVHGYGYGYYGYGHGYGSGLGLDDYGAVQFDGFGNQHYGFGTPDMACTAGYPGSLSFNRPLLHQGNYTERSAFPPTPSPSEDRMRPLEAALSYRHSHSYNPEVVSPDNSVALRAGRAVVQGRPKDDSGPAKLAESTRNLRSQGRPLGSTLFAHLLPSTTTNSIRLAEHHREGIDHKLNISILASRRTDVMDHDVCVKNREHLPLKADSSRTVGSPEESATTSMPIPMVESPTTPVSVATKHDVADGVGPSGRKVVSTHKMKTVLGLGEIIERGSKTTTSISSSVPDEPALAKQAAGITMFLDNIEVPPLRRLKRVHPSGRRLPYLANLHVQATSPPYADNRPGYDYKDVQKVMEFRKMLIAQKAGEKRKRTDDDGDAPATKKPQTGPAR